MLFTCLKDFKAEEPLRLMRLNQTRLTRSAVTNKGFDLQGSVSLKNPCQPINVVFTERISRSVYEEIINGLPKLKFYDLPYSIDDTDVKTVKGMS